MSKVREQALLYVAANDMTNNIKSFAVELNSIAQSNKIVLLRIMVFKGDSCQVYGRYLDLVRDNVVDYYTLLYREEEQCTSIVHGYFGEV